MKVTSLLLITVISMAGIDCMAQSTSTKQVKKEAKAQRKNQKVEEGRSIITPIAAPGYTPELGGLIAVGGLWSFKPGKTKYPNMQRSSMPFTIGYTTTGAIVANALLTSFWFDDKVRVYGDFWYKNMPDHYWGIGEVAGSEVAKSDSTTAFDREWFWFNPRILWQVKKNYFIGVNIDVNSTFGSDASEGVASDPNYSVYNDRPLNTGLGLILQFDSRDFIVNAYEGWYLNLSATHYDEDLGGDNDYNVYSAEYRRYDQVGKIGRTLASMAKVRIADGEVPYGEMSQLGTPFDLRGYTWGRYRDNSMFYFITEYRHKIYQEDDTPSKHGVVGWMGSGIVFDHEDMSNDNENRWLPNFGVGYRFEIQPRMDIRIDLGIGRESSGFYFNFNQAF